MMGGTPQTKETVEVMHSLMKEHSGMIQTMTDMEITLYLPIKETLVPIPTALVTKINSGALMETLMAIQTMEMHSLMTTTNGQILILMDTEIITTMMFSNLLNYTSTNAAMHFQ